MDCAALRGIGLYSCWSGTEEGTVQGRSRWWMPRPRHVYQGSMPSLPPYASVVATRAFCIPCHRGGWAPRGCRQDSSGPGGASGGAGCGFSQSTSQGRPPYPAGTTSHAKTGRADCSEYAACLVLFEAGTSLRTGHCLSPRYLDSCIWPEQPRKPDWNLFA